MTWFIFLYSLSSSSSSSSIQGPTVSAKKVCLLVCQVTIVSWCYSYLTVSFSRRYRAVRLQRFVLSSVIFALLSMMTWQYNLTQSPLFFLQEPTFPPSKVSLLFVPFALSLLWNMKSHALPVTLLLSSVIYVLLSMMTRQHNLTLSPLFFMQEPTFPPTKVGLVVVKLLCLWWWPISIVLHYHLSFSCRSQPCLLQRLVL